MRGRRSLVKRLGKRCGVLTWTRMAPRDWSTCYQGPYVSERLSPDGKSIGRKVGQSSRARIQGDPETFVVADQPRFKYRGEKMNLGADNYFADFRAFLGDLV